MQWAETLLDKVPDSLKTQYVQLKEEAESAASNMAKKIESGLHIGGAKGAGPKEASSPAGTGCAASSSTAGNDAGPSAPADEQGSPVEAPTADPQRWTRFLPSFLSGPVDRIDQYMRGELDFKGLGICNCFVGPTVGDKGQANQKSKSAYGLGVCVCCVGGDNSKQQESDMRKKIEEKLQASHGGNESSSRLGTTSAAEVLSRYHREGRTTQAGARARAEARVQRILALQERAEERTARLNGRLAKPRGNREGHIESQAKDVLAKAQQRRRQDIEDDKAAGEMPLSLRVDL
jgi:hypothetical protein